MRFIVHEQPYETRIATGQFRYEQGGRRTGAVETWRLTGAPDGHTVLRVDLDAREAASGHSYLYNLVRDEAGRPQRLAYRFWSSELEIAGTLLFEATSVTGTREVNGKVHAEDQDLQPGYLFWFPSAVGLGLTLHAAKVTGNHAVTLNGAVGGANSMALQQVAVDVYFMITDTIEVEVAGRTVTAVPTMVRWNDQQRVVVRDLNYWPVVIERPNYLGGQALTAKETRYIWM